MALPIRIKQFPNFTLEMLRRSVVLRKDCGREPIFHLCFFSCNSYFKYLYCSLHSLVGNVGRHSLKVYVFSDDEQPLSDKQAEVLAELVPGIQIISWPKSMGWGEKQIDSIWRAYRKVADEAEDDDIIARVDSDVFFFNDTIFRLVARSDADLVGDGHYVDFNYAQGGCYFFRASAVKKISKWMASKPDDLYNGVDPIVEDVAAFQFAGRLGLKICLTWFMMFPDELRNAGGITRWQHKKFSCVHFVMKNKQKMLEAYDKYMFDGKLPAQYLEGRNVL